MGATVTGNGITFNKKKRLRAWMDQSINTTRKIKYCGRAHATAYCMLILPYGLRGADVPTCRHTDRWFTNTKLHQAPEPTATVGLQVSRLDPTRAGLRIGPSPSLNHSLNAPTVQCVGSAGRALIVLRKSRPCSVGSLNRLTIVPTVRSISICI